MQYQEETVVEESRPGRKIGWIIATLAILAALVFIKLHYFPSQAAGGKGGGAKGAGGGPGGPGGAGGAKPKVPVQVYVVQTTSLSDEVAATGSVLADESVVIRSEIPGKITSLNIAEGRPVSKGQLLFTINAADVQAQLQKQQYNIKLYRDQEKRQRTLLAREFISQQEYEQANNQLLTAQAELQALRANLDKAYVKAPFSGILGLTTATVGTYVSPGAQITTLSRIEPVKIDFTVPSRFATSVKVKDAITVTDEATTKKYDARVYAINPQIDPVSRTLQIRAIYPNHQQELRPGAFVKVNLQLGEATAALQVPTEAVVPVASGYQVYKIKKGKVAPAPVKIGVRSDKVIQLTEGIAVGDTIVRTGVLIVKPGDAVVITK